MPLAIAGTEYLTTQEVLAEIGITRQTFHRWRKEGRVPAGHKYRNQVIFSEAEVGLIRDYANRIEPVDFSSTSQLPLFNSKSGGK